ncbi:MAG: hypothetical protein IKY97_05030, partial [Mailhella sp.]|nr:hypothetical protein [Mailhella sp.]
PPFSKAFYDEAPSRTGLGLFAWFLGKELVLAWGGARGMRQAKPSARRASSLLHFPMDLEQEMA